MNKMCCIFMAMPLATLAMQSKSSTSQLLNAIYNNDPVAVESHLIKGADPNEWNELGQPALSLAIMYADPFVVNLLLHHKANTICPDKNGQSPLHYAAATGKHHISSLLLELGADVNQRCNQGYSPLMQAAVFGQPEACMILLRAKPNLKIQNKWGETALELAQFYVNFTNILSLDKQMQQQKEGRDYTQTLSILQEAYRKSN